MYCSSKCVLGRVESGLVEADEPPGCALGGGEVALDPIAQLAVGPVDGGVGVEHGPVDVAVVEREVRHPREGVAGGGEERLLVRLGADQRRRDRAALLRRRAVERLGPVVEVGQAVGQLTEVARGDVVVARRGDEERRAEQGDTRCRRRLVGVVDGPELVAVLGGEAPGVDDVARDHHVIRPGKEGAVGDRLLLGRIGTAVAEGHEPLRLARHLRARASASKTTWPARLTR